MSDRKRSEHSATWTQGGVAGLGVGGGEVGGGGGWEGEVGWVVVARVVHVHLKNV